MTEVTLSVAPKSNMDGVSNWTTDSDVFNTTISPYDHTDPAPRVCNRCVNIAYVMIGLLGVIGNLIVIVVMYKTHGVRKQVTRILIINQSALDMVSALLQAATNIVLLSYDLQFDFRGAELVCRVFYNQVFMWDTLVSSTYNLMALNLERYVQVVHPITHKISFTQRRAKIVAACIWLVGPCINSYAFFTSGVRDNKCMMNSIWPRPWVATFVGFFKLTVQFFLPVFVMVYSYVRMFIAIRKRASLSPDPAPNPAEAPTAASIARYKRSVSIQRNIFKTLTMVTVCFVLCWSWNQFFIMLFYLDYPVHWDTVYYRFSVFMVLLNCSCNPVIYSITYDPFRHGFKLLFDRHTTVATITITSSSGSNHTNTTGLQESKC